MAYRISEYNSETRERLWQSQTAYDSYDEAERRAERLAVGRYTEFAIECLTCHTAAESPHYHDKPALTEENNDA